MMITNMKSRRQSIQQCAVLSLSSRGCGGEVTEVILVPGYGHQPSVYPGHLPLCQVHHQLELMVWGIRKFFEVYPLLESDSAKSSGSEPWREALLPESADSRLYYSLSEELEFRLNRFSAGDSGGSCQARAEFDHLRDAPIDLGEARLTDKQLMAVCMVFYGGVKKKRAAQAMNITSQALADHIRAALKKIEHNLAG